MRKDALIDREEVEKDAAGELQQIAFIISDQSKDRYGDTVSADGWDFTAYNTNRVLLWAHDYGMPPVGEMGEPWKTVGNKIKAVVDRWVPESLSPFAAAIEGMVRQGFLKTVSVGFRPAEYSYNDDYSINYIKQELLEVSVVPVPANPNALVAAKSAGLWIPEIDRWIEQKLDEKQPGPSFEIAKFAWGVTRSAQVAGSVKVPDVEADDAPALPEVVELRSALEANTRALTENTAAVKSLELVTKQFTEATEKAAAPQLRAVKPSPPTPLNPDRIAARALEQVKNTKL